MSHGRRRLRTLSNDGSGQGHLSGRADLAVGVRVVAFDLAVFSEERLDVAHDVALEFRISWPDISIRNGLAVRSREDFECDIGALSEERHGSGWLGLDVPCMPPLWQPYRFQLIFVSYSDTYSAFHVTHSPANKPGPGWK